MECLLCFIRLFYGTPTRQKSKKEVDILLEVQVEMKQLKNENTRSLEKSLKGLNEEAKILSLLGIN